MDVQGLTTHLHATVVPGEPQGLKGIEEGRHICGIQLTLHKAHYQELKMVVGLSECTHVDVHKVCYSGHRHLLQ